MSYADVNGICLYYEEHGSARSVARSGEPKTVLVRSLA